ncbi:MAG: hypothetical protein IPJ18_22710 [Betaproteobacteria bacterium]|nr:hypothetical protein [Betaproteobacteria bacterium]
MQLVRNRNGADPDLQHTEPSVLSGETGQLALHLSAKAGRLFTQAAERDVGMPLRIGPPRAPHWTWREVRLKKLSEPAWHLQAYIDGTAAPRNPAALPTRRTSGQISNRQVGLPGVAGMSAFCWHAAEGAANSLSLLPQYETARC